MLGFPGFTIGEIFEAGAQRVSVGGGMAWVAVAAMADAVTTLLETGDLSPLDVAVPLDRWFA